MSFPDLNLTIESVLDNMPSTVLVSNEVGEIVYANKMAANFLGYSNLELIEMTIHNLVPDKVLPSHAALQQSYLEAPFQRSLHAGPGNIQVKTKSGTLIAVDISLNHIKAECGQVRILSVIQDASIRISIEKQTRRIHKSLSGIQPIKHDLDRLGQDLVWRCDLEGRFIYLNHRWEELLSYEPRLTLGECFEVFLKPTERDRVSSEFSRLVAEEGQIIGLKMVFLDSKNEEVHLLINAKPMRNSDDELIGIQGTATDITQLQHAENERQAIEERLINVQKQEALGRLVGGIAHDFNNLLHVVVGNASLLIDESLVEGEDLELVTQIMKAADRGTGLVKQLLTFGKPAKTSRQGLDIAKAIDQDLVLLRQMCGHKCKVISVLSEDLPLANANAGQFSQILFNLVLNARDAMCSEGEVLIECSRAEQGYDNRRLQGGLKSGAIEVRVIDKGMGMDSKTKQLIFDPFFTTKGPDEGTGLGLSTVFNIVRQSGGEIHVDSKPGEGTTFTLLFPLFSRVGPLPLSLNQSNHVGYLKGSETILLGITEEKERNYMKRSFSLQGYHVILAENPDHALEISANKDLVINLLVTDFTSTTTEGLILGSIISKNRPNIKTIFLSESDDNIIASYSRAKALDMYLVKPFNLGALLKLTRVTLNNANGNNSLFLTVESA